MSASIISIPTQGDQLVTTAPCTGKQVKPCPRLLRLDRRRPLYLEDFFGKGWKFAEGEKQHPSLLLREVDPAMLLYLDCMQDNEPPITGVEKLRRLQEVEGTPLHAAWGHALWLDYYKDNPSNSVLEWLYEEFGLTCLDFFAGKLLGPSGSTNIYFLYRDSRRTWHCACNWIGYSNYQKGVQTPVYPHVSP